MTNSVSLFAQSRPRDGSGAFLPTVKVYDRLLEYESVRSWIDNYTAPMTRRNYLTALNVICRRVGLSPDQIVQTARSNGDKAPREFKNQVKEILHGYVQEGKLGEAKKIYAALRSFLTAHEVTIVFSRQEKVHYRRKKVADEKVPVRQDVYALVDAVDRVKGWHDPLKKLRAKAMILCAYQSGVRPGCVVRWTFGLVRENLFPEVKVPVPLRITADFDSKLAGYDLPYYYTFLGREAAFALREYIEARMNRGARLDDGSPIFTTLGTNSKDKPASYDNYYLTVKRVAKTAGMSADKIWPHLLRKAFKKVLNRAEIDDDTREALMGHRLPGSRENYFDRHDIPDVAARYMQCSFGKEDARDLIEDQKRIEALEEDNKRLREQVRIILEAVPTLQRETLKENIRNLGYDPEEIIRGAIDNDVLKGKRKPLGMTMFEDGKRFYRVIISPEEEIEILQRFLKGKLKSSRPKMRQPRRHYSDL